MKIEISIEKDGNESKKPEGEMDGEDTGEMSSEMKAAIANKIKKNIGLTRAERTMLAGYLMEDED